VPRSPCTSHWAPTGSGGGVALRIGCTPELHDAARCALAAHACSRAADARGARRGRHDYGVRNYVAAARHLAALQADGLVRHVGVTNFDVPRLREMLDAGVRIVSNQARGRPALGLAEVIRPR
jgi:hypothetical protein